MRVLLLQSQPWGPMGLANPSPPMSGRHLSALSAVRRQPSWGGRSSVGLQVPLQLLNDLSHSFKPAASSPPNL